MLSKSVNYEVKGYTTNCFHGKINEILLSFVFQSDYKPVAVSGSDFLYLEHAICFFSLKTFEETALGIGINFTKDAR